MTPKRKKLLGVALMGGITLSGIMVARGAEGDPAPPSPAPTAPPPPAAADPTQPSPLLQEVLSNGGPSSSKTKGKIPNITLKAKVVVANKPAVAMLNIEGSYYTVREGVELAFASQLTGTVNVVVKKLDSDEIQLELTPLNQTLILR